MGLKVLIVDDEPLTHLLYKTHIERAGYQMLAATDGGQALQIAKREGPDLIIMDIMMKDMDGLAALRELKGDETTKGIPVIIITASVSSHLATRRESESSGAAAFLTKPLSPSQLLSEITRLLPLPKTGE
jgi:CheY-like chemotaxis protein